MEISFWHIFTPSLLGFLALNAYVWWRVCVLWCKPKALRWGLGVGMLVLSLAYAHVARGALRDGGWNLMARWAELWLGCCWFLASWFLVAEVAWFCARRFGWNDGRLRNLLFGGAVALAMGTSVYAYWHAKQLHVVHYALTVRKDAGDLRHLRVAVLADLHVGKGPPPLKLGRVVELTNAQHPDLVVLAGDIAEYSAKEFDAKGYDAVLRGLRAPMGVYAVRGNHDYFDLDRTLLRRTLRRAGIVLLEDSMMNVADSFYVAGRKDCSQPRAPLSMLLQRADANRPVLVINHRPDGLVECESAGADVQFSGHTHGGQFFPATLFTRLIYPINSGVLREGPFALVVSSGLWGGAPYRLGTQSEIVVVDIDFAGKDA